MLLEKLTHFYHYGPFVDFCVLHKKLEHVYRHYEPLVDLFVGLVSFFKLARVEVLHSNTVPSLTHLDV